MAKGPLVDNRIKLLIASINRDHPDWPAKMIKDAIHKRLGQNWPGLSVVQKELRRIKKRLTVEIPEDKLWNTATLDDYPIPPEALSVVMKMLREMGSMTIREAKWASRFSALIPEHIPDIENLIMIVTLYSNYEKLYETSGITVDFTELDNRLMGLPPNIANITTELIQDNKWNKTLLNESIEKALGISSEKEVLNER